ncbi:MAG: HAD-IIB family hydrolase [Crenarchaeota archaeon]|nr:HAD-IIB family hydrolase [Thermoproteota archaeon]
MKNVIFSDIDGTILSEDYSFESVKPAINQLTSLGIPIILCSSKTRAEIEFYRKEIGIKDPFISENGAAIFIPKNYFSQMPKYDKSTDQYNIIEIGTPYFLLRQKIKDIRERNNIDIIGFGDLSAEELSKESKLPLELAILAKQREYDEPFRVLTDNENQLINIIDSEGLYLTKGDCYWHLKGNHDKGSAVTSLIELFSQNFGQIRTAGIGNSPNDLPMLSAVEKPFWVGETDQIEKVWKKVVMWVSE